MSEASSVAAIIGVAPGAIGGICNVFVGHPVDLVKVRMQTATSKVQAAAAARLNTFGALRTIYTTDGVTGLYRGVSAPLLAAIPAFAVVFWSFDIAKNAMLRNSTETQLTIPQSFVAGAFSGLNLSAVNAPAERIKCNMQVNGFASFTACARHLYNEGGVRSIYKGCGATMLRDIPGNAAYFGCYEILKRSFQRMEGTEKPSFTAIFMAGGLAGVSNWIVAIPFDTIKSRFQTAPPGMYRSVFQVFTELVRQEGTGALFRGLSPALIRAFPANGACLAGVESARAVFSHFQLS